MKTGIFKQDFKSELPDGSEGWLIKKGTLVNIIEVDKEYGVLCEYLEYTFYCNSEYLELNKEAL